MLRDKFVYGLNKGAFLDRISEKDGTSSLTECKNCCPKRNEVYKISSASHNKMHQNNNQTFGNCYQRKRGDPSVKAKAANHTNATCYACGEGNHDFKTCVYKKYKCKLCREQGHLAKMCRNKKQNNYLEEVHEIYNMGQKNDQICINVKVNTKDVQFEIDTGSAVSVCSEQFYNDNFRGVKGHSLKPVKSLFKSYNESEIQPIGSFDTNIKKQIYPVTILVIPNGGRPLIGRDVLKRMYPKMDEFFVNNIKTDDFPKDVASLISDFKDLFKDELGCYKFGKVKIELREECKPIFCKPRSVPLAFQSKFKTQLEKSIQSGILKKFEFSSWGTPLVPVLKSNGDIRICADYKSTVNPYIKDYKFSLPLIEDLFAALNGGQLFTKLDMSNAYNQVELEEESQSLLAWSTQEGLFAPTRLPFGISPACSMFQSIRFRTLQGCIGVICFLDYILIAGTNHRDHLENLRVVFNKLSGAGFRLGREKCQFFEKSVRYLGYIVDKDGLHTD